MNGVGMKLRAHQTSLHIKALKSWQKQEAIALAKTIIEQNQIIAQLERLEQAINAAELEYFLLTKKEWKP